MQIDTILFGYTKNSEEGTIHCLVPEEQRGYDTNYKITISFKNIYEIITIHIPYCQIDLNYHNIQRYGTYTTIN